MVSAHKKFAILISGPTATGKTDFVLQLGKSIPEDVTSIEIVNADIGSFYTHLTIGTAKPDWRSQQIPHHFFDVIDGVTSWTAPQFREKLEILMHEIWSRGNTPVIVGGSAFYIQSFFYKNHTLQAPTFELMQSLEAQSSIDLWEQLYAIDPARATKIDMNDHYRLVRALAIWQTQGQIPSSFQPVFQPLSPFFFITLTRNRDQLYAIIDQRVKLMIENGWIDEVAQLAQDPIWRDFLQQKKMIGYDLLLDYLETDLQLQDFEQAVDLIAQRTRNYAKRQITFLGKLQKNIQESMVGDKEYQSWHYLVEECNLTLCDLSLYIKQLSERISQFLE